MTLREDFRFRGEGQPQIYELGRGSGSRASAPTKLYLTQFIVNYVKVPYYVPSTNSFGHQIFSNRHKNHVMRAAGMLGIFIVFAVFARLDKTAADISTCAWGVWDFGVNQITDIRTATPVTQTNSWTVSTPCSDAFYYVSTRVMIVSTTKRYTAPLTTLSIGLVPVGRYTASYVFSDAILTDFHLSDIFTMESSYDIVVNGTSTHWGPYYSIWVVAPNAAALPTTSSTQTATLPQLEVTTTTTVIASSTASNDSTKIIVGGVVGGVLGLLFIIGILWLLWYRMKALAAGNSVERQYDPREHDPQIGSLMNELHPNNQSSARETVGREGLKYPSDFDALPSGEVRRV